MSKPTLKLDWCSHAAAKFAVENWHYSRSIPKSKLVKVGAWENQKFIGCVIFSYGATPQIGSPYNLTQFQVCELTRVALTQHATPTSKIVSYAIKMLCRQSPGIRLIVSFADGEQGHLGVLYQATNWLYAGTTKPGRVGFVIKGKKVHTRTIGSMPGGVQSLVWVRTNVDPNAEEWIGVQKHRYLMPLDPEMRKQLEPLAKPYPKRATSIDADAVAFQVTEGGSIPTVALQ